MFNKNKTFSNFQSKYIKNVIGNSGKITPANLILSFQKFVPGTSDPEPIVKKETEVRVFTDNIDQFNITRYPYGDIQEGEIAFFIPIDDFPEPPIGYDMIDLTLVEIEFHGNTYSADREFIDKGWINNDAMYKAIVLPT